MGPVEVGQVEVGPVEVGPVAAEETLISVSVSCVCIKI